MGEKLQVFFESTTGQVITVILILLLLVWIMAGGKKDKKVNVEAMTISALMIALAIVLGQVKIFEMPQGGAITLFSTLPIVACGYLLGTRRGVTAGVCVGLLNLIFGPYVIHPAQMLLDYPMAYGALGLSGLVRDKKNGLTKGYILGVFARYVCAVLSGVIFFGAYAPEGFNGLTWSLWYNLTYLAAEGVLTVLVINIPQIKHAFERGKNSL